MTRTPGHVWGRQHPFERQHLQRAMALLSLGTVSTATTVVMASAHPARALGSALVSVGLVCGLAAGSRHRYVRESQLGFMILASRDGRFVLSSAVGLLVAAGLAVLAVLA